MKFTLEISIPVDFQVTKDLKRQRAGCKYRDKYMNHLKESSSNKTTSGGSRDTSNASSDATNTNISAYTSATDAITRSTNTNIYGVGIVTVVAIDGSIFFAYSKKSSQTSNK